MDVNISRAKKKPLEEDIFDEDRNIADGDVDQNDFQVKTVEFKKWFKEERPFKCCFCQETFAQIDIFQEHKRTHFSEMPYECSRSYCKSSFKTVAALRSHLRIHDRGPYKCEVCERRFNIANDFKNHMGTHK